MTTVSDPIEGVGTLESWPHQQFAHNRFGSEATAARDSSHNRDSNASSSDLHSRIHSDSHSLLPPSGYLDTLATARKMQVSQQTPTQVNEDRDYGVFSHTQILPSSPIQDSASRGDSYGDEPPSLGGSDAGAITIPHVTGLAHTSSQATEDGGLEISRGAWRQQDTTSCPLSGPADSPAQAPFRVPGVSPATPALRENPFAKRFSYGVPLTGSQLFAQTPLGEARAASPTSSRPSPDLHHASISSNLLVASPLKNRANMSSPTLPRTSSPPPLQPPSDPSASIKAARGSGAEEGDLSDRTCMLDERIPESPKFDDPRREAAVDQEPVNQMPEMNTSSLAQRPLSPAFNGQHRHVLAQGQGRWPTKQGGVRAGDEIPSIDYMKLAVVSSPAEELRRIKRRRLGSEMGAEAAGECGRLSINGLPDDDGLGALDGAAQRAEILLMTPSAPSVKASPGGESAAEEGRMPRGGLGAIAPGQNMAGPVDDDMVPATSPELPSTARSRQARSRAADPSPEQTSPRRRRRVPGRRGRPNSAKACLIGSRQESTASPVTATSSELSALSHTPEAPPAVSPERAQSWPRPARSPLLGSAWPRNSIAGSWGGGGEAVADGIGPSAGVRVTRRMTRSLRIESGSTEASHSQLGPAASFPGQDLATGPTRGAAQSLGSTQPGRRLFDGMVFDLSFHAGAAGQQRRARVEKQLVQGGATLLREGFRELFERVPLASPEETLVAGEWGGLRLARARLGSGFTALIADGHSRKAKYMQALGLGLPCLAPQWIAACVERGEMVDWEPYLLCAGSSAVLGGAVRSRTLQAYGAAEAKLAEVVGRRRRLLEGQGVLVMASGTGSKEQHYMFLVQALGPSVMARVSTEEQASEALRGGQFGWLYVDGKAGPDEWKTVAGSGPEPKPEAGPGPRRGLGGGWRKRKRGMGQERAKREEACNGVKLLTDELVIQSLILGRMVTREEMTSS